jgi:hypothetical protein
MAYTTGEPEVNRLTAQNYYIDASYSVVVSIDYEIGSGFVTEIAALGVLEII